MTEGVGRNDEGWVWAVRGGVAGITGRGGYSLVMKVKTPCVYILASGTDGTLYIGVTSQLAQRVWEHKNDVAEGFTKRYGVHTLVWYEAHESMDSAISREKALKRWKRAWKIRLITSVNPTWEDLYDSLE